MSEKRKRNLNMITHNNNDDGENNNDDNNTPELLTDDKKQRTRLSDHLVTQYLEAIQQNNTLMKNFMEIMQKTNTLLENIPTLIINNNNNNLRLQNNATSSGINNNNIALSNEELEYIQRQKKENPIPDPQTMEFITIEYEKENPNYERADRERPYNDRCIGCNGECLIRIVNKKEFAKYGIPYSECPVPMKDRSGKCLQYGRNGKKWYYDTKEKYRADAIPTEDQLILIRLRRPYYYESIMRYCKMMKIDIIRTPTKEE